MTTELVDCMHCETSATGAGDFTSCEGLIMEIAESEGITGLEGVNVRLGALSIDKMCKEEGFLGIKPRVGLRVNKC